MHLSIFERLKPFSHLPGTIVPIPGSQFAVKVYPTRFSIFNFETEKELGGGEFNFSGPIKDFTVQLDLEKGRVRVWGDSLEGYFRYSLFLFLYDEITLTVEKCPASVSYLSSGVQLRQGDISQLAEELPKLTQRARLSLGKSKAQDWDLSRRRHDIGEALPFWFALAQWYIQKSTSDQSDNAPVVPSLFNQCEEALIQNDTLALVPAFSDLFLAGFEGILTPRAQDLDYQGFRLPVINQASPMKLLSDGVNLIQRIFIQQNANELNVLSCLPPEFTVGKLIGFPLEKGILQLEWTKKKIRRMMLLMVEAQGMKVNFHKIRSFRLKQSEQDRGQRMDNHSELFFEAGQPYYFDRFE